ncbi:aldehyde dehydrogenase family protein, partial [Pseudarthrobacter sp. R1]|uniref:aldehyde dehydrogenase family protein n=1 Tax=Pseudarthrobacter sp. R1 TaxID=2944934 RepID=UPI00210C7867
MPLFGHSLIAGEPVAGDGKTTFGFNPATNQALEPTYTLLNEDQLKAATAAAAEASPSFSTLDPETHASFLEAIADNIEAIGEELITRAGQETGLPAARLQGERARTTGQLRLFASVVRQGDFRGVRIDPALPERTPLPRADIRQRQIPLGPVAVFGASGDTASALAAGCPVVFKAHNAHPGTSELVGQAIAKAVKDNGLHPGVFSLVYGPGASIGQALVADPAIKAVGFTGSQSAGVALMRTAAARPEPIPVYAEMSSLNPVFVFEGALKGDIDALAQQYVTSVTGSSGQLCTSPGLLFAPEGELGDKLAAAVGRAVSACAGQTMLTAGIADSWNAGTKALGSAGGVQVIGQGTAGPTENAPAPTIFGTGVTEFSGDTASALAAGCPVVFKAHNAHPGTSELVGQAIAKAVKDNGLHPGVFSLVYGPGASIGQALVADPAIKAVGFTGSQSAGVALMRTAAARPEPIPVYAEMSSLNPVFVFNGALKGDIDALAQQYVTSVTGSSGQLCTSPGLLFAPEGEDGDKLAAAVGRAVSACAGQTMLTAGIAESWNAGTKALGSAGGVQVIGQGTPGPTENAPAPTIFGTGVTEF